MPDERETRAGKSKQVKCPETTDTLMAAISQALNSKEFIGNITAVVMQAVRDKFDELMEQQKTMIDKLAEDNAKLKLENVNLSSRVDSTEQYLLRNKIRLLGIPENESFKTLSVALPAIFNRHLGMNISSEDIESCFRVGKTSANKNNPRAIIVSFCTHQLKKAVFNNKSKFKSTGLSVKEVLTPSRFKIFSYACEKFGFRNVWSNDGDVFAKVNNSVLKLKNISDIDGYCNN